MKTLLGLAAIATLAIALPASAAEHGKKHDTKAAPESVSSSATAGAMAPTAMPVTAKKATVKKSKP